MSKLEAKHEGFGRWNVVDESGKKQNTEPLSKEEATKMTNKQETVAPKRNARRRERTTFGQMRSQLKLDDATTERITEMGKVGRWVNDEDAGGRLKQMHDRGYDFFSANGSEVIGDPDGGYEPPKEGSHMRKHVGITRGGEPMYAYFMVTNVEHYQEDQDAKEAINSQVDDAIRGGDAPGPNQTATSSALGSTSVKDVKYKP